MKRKTPEGRTTQTLDTGAAIAVASVLRKCLSWRDRCGRVRTPSITFIQSDCTYHTQHHPV